MTALVLLLCWTASVTLQAQSRLLRQGTATQITLDGQPTLLLGGELSNSAASSVADIDNVIPRVAQRGLNTVLVPAYWDLMEPTEGQYDFSLIDRTIKKCRENQLKVVFLWFGVWKNSMSCYAPLWFKENTKKYPRCVTKAGKPLEIASPFSEAVFQADSRAFTALMRHMAAVDGQQHTIIMMQIENEIGMLENARDYSPAATKLFNAPLPKELVSYLKAHEQELHPKLVAKLQEQGTDVKAIGGKSTWGQVFGTDIYAEEIFMAYHYACYVERLARIARQTYDMPLYVNAAMNSRGRKPGEYPSAGPLAHLIDLWHCGAPSIDILAPDLYDNGFKGWVAQYKLHNNPLFIPECRQNENTAARALYAFGEYDAIGFCPFGIDDIGKQDGDKLQNAYRLLRQLSPLLLKSQGSGRNHGILLDKQDQEKVISDGTLQLTAKHFYTLGWDARYKTMEQWPEAGGIVIKLADKEFLIAGTGLVVTFAYDSEAQTAYKRKLGEDGFVEKGDDGANETANGQQTKARNTRFTGKRIGIGYVDQVSIDGDGRLQYLRRDNGDQDHQGRHARITMNEWKILHVKLYEY